MTQSDALDVLAVLLGLYAWHKGHWRAVGLLFGFGGALKFYPALMLAPALLDRRTRRQVVVGPLPPVILSFALLIVAGPIDQPVATFIDKNHKFGLFDGQDPWGFIFVPLGGRGTITTPTLLIGAPLTAIWARWGSFPADELRPLIAGLPTIYLFTEFGPHHFVVFVIGFGWIALLYDLRRVWLYT